MTNHSGKMVVGFLLGGSIGEKVLREIYKKYLVAYVLTDSSSQCVINTAKICGIPLYVGNPREGRASKFINEKGYAKPDVLVSANYRFLIDSDLIELPRLFAINIHGSLLPRYRGRAPLIWSIINGDEYSGITIHKIDDGCDTGPVIYQKKVNIPPDATGADMVDQFAELYPVMLNEVLKSISNGDYNLTPQNEAQATYYGKRTPEDGLINWSWHRERIYNWVRALAPPYPGAYAYNRDKKVIISSLSFSHHGYSCHDPDGLVLKVENQKPVVKSPNGAVTITEYCLVGGGQLYVGDLLTDVKFNHA